MTTPSTPSPPFVIDAVFARQFAAEWIESWNAHDLARILSHYTDDFEMRSPLIVERMKIPSGVLRGKDAVAKYWSIGLAAQPSESSAVHLSNADRRVAGWRVVRSVTRQRRVDEWFQLESRGKVCRSASAYAV